jgi:short-subunit dehydrogenase
MGLQVSLVTGASSGIGEALARRLAADRRHLVLIARRRDRLDALAAKLRSEHGVDAIPMAIDLTAPGAVAELVADLGRRGMTVDWLINNAGFGTHGRFDTLPVEKELNEIQLNVATLVELTGRLVPAMVERGRGAVMNISSVGGFAPGPYMATYCATKAFVLNFSEALAAELKPTGVHVLCVCPGFTRTEFQDTANVDTGRIPSFVWMSADAVADQAVRAVGKKTVCVTGMMNSVTASTVRLLPPSWSARMVGGLMKSSAGS